MADKATDNHKTRRWRGGAWRVPGRVIVLLLLGVTALWAMQDSLLYHPERTRLEATLSEAARQHLHPWPTADDYRGLRREPVGGATTTLLLFHGNAGLAGDRRFYADALAALGWRVILLEYPGYGPRPGKPGEERLVGDALESLRLAHRQYGNRLVVAGESLGAGVAAALAARAKAEGLALGGLLLITPWDTLANTARHHYPWLPVSALLRDRYDSASHLAALGSNTGGTGESGASIPYPLVLVVAEADEIIPASLGRRLHDQAPAGSRLLLLPGVGHNDWPDATDSTWWRALAGHFNGASLR